MNNDLISRQQAFDAVRAALLSWSFMPEWRDNKIIEAVEQLPPIQPVNNSENPNSSDVISRQAAIEAINEIIRMEHSLRPKVYVAKDAIKALPSAQPERTCVNCGRTANNGGWYADGRTRCPIEEHYALPKDGYCHLWEKRNVTDDDYPERRTDE